MHVQEELMNELDLIRIYYFWITLILKSVSIFVEMTKSWVFQFLKVCFINKVESRCDRIFEQILDYCKDKKLEIIYFNNGVQKQK